MFLSSSLTNSWLTYQRSVSSGSSLAKDGTRRGWRIHSSSRFFLPTHLNRSMVVPFRAALRGYGCGPDFGRLEPMTFLNLLKSAEFAPSLLGVSSSTDPAG